MNESLERGFMLGIAVARHVHGIRARFRDDSSDRILETLEAIAHGKLTLVDTPEEIAAETRPPDSVVQRLPEILRESRKQERQSAIGILRSITGDPSYARE